MPFGNLYFDRIRSGEISSFEYANSWLAAGNNWLLDPDLVFFKGRQYPPNRKSLFGVFSDSCPDRWGRMLIQRKEARIAAQERRLPRKLFESDYLLGINDMSRMGALRFSTESGIIATQGKDDSIPPWARLRALESASRALESEDAVSEQLDASLSLLLAPGSSLGGARPKANVEDPQGNLWIAKFPSFVV